MIIQKKFCCFSTNEKLRIDAEILIIFTRGQALLPQGVGCHFYSYYNLKTAKIKILASGKKY